METGDESPVVHSAGINEFPDEQSDLQVTDSNDEADSETWMWDGERWTRVD